jgi:hypothetical protein
MGRKSGVTKETTKNLILDSGVVYLNWGSTDISKPQMVLGACRGGNSFTIETNWRDMPFDGVGGIVRGARRPISVTASLTANLVEINKELLKIAIPGADYDSGSPAVDEKGNVIVGEKQYSIKRVLAKAIPSLEYYDVALVSKFSGTESPVVCVVKNSLNNGNLEMSFSDEDEAVISITFTGTFDAENINEEPWEILIPEPEA